jgi:uncharacterized protein (TIGR01777 family)
MRIIIAGGTGLIGSKLANQFLNDGHEIFMLSRRPEKFQKKFPSNITLVQWDGKSLGEWGKFINGAQVIIFLNGMNISSGRWTKKRKQEIIESRVIPGSILSEAIMKSSKKPDILIHASGVGFYGSNPNVIFNEASPPGDDFASYVCVKNEQSTQSIENFGIRRVIIRQAPVLSKDSIILSRMKLPFFFFVGGTLGSGNQWFPWIHIEDHVNAIRMLIEKSQATGIYNLVSPIATTNKEFAHTISEVIKRPSWLPIPPFVLKAIFGEMASLLLEGQHLTTEKLIQMGFQFQYPDIHSALTQILGKP